MQDGARAKCSLKNLNLLLQLASQYINPALPGLMRETWNNQVFEELLSKIDQILNDSDTLEKAGQKAAEINQEYNEDLRSHLWATCVKKYFMHSELYAAQTNMDDVFKSFRRTRILQYELKKYIVDFFNRQTVPVNDKVNYKLDLNYDYKICPAEVGFIFTRFIGQLIQDGQVASAQAIHNFLYLCSSIAQNRPLEECKYSVVPGDEINLKVDKIHGFDVIGSSVSPCLLEALELSGNLCLELGPEMQFMRAVSYVLLQRPLFSQPFTAALYEGQFQPSDTNVHCSGLQEFLEKALSFSALGVTPLIENVKQRAAESDPPKDQESLSTQFKRLSVSGDNLKKPASYMPPLQLDKQKQFASSRNKSLSALLSPKRGDKESPKRAATTVGQPGEPMVTAFDFIREGGGAAVPAPAPAPAPEKKKVTTKSRFGLKKRDSVDKK